MLEQWILMNLKLLLNIRTIWIILIETLKNTNRKHKIFIVFDNMIPDMLNNKNLNPIRTELFIRGKQLNISLVFIT